MPMQADLTDLSQIIPEWIQIPHLELLARLFVRAPENLLLVFVKLESGRVAYSNSNIKGLTLTF